MEDKDMKANHKDVHAAIREMNEAIWYGTGNGFWLTRKDFLHDEERLRAELTTDDGGPRQGDGRGERGRSP